MIVRRPRSDPRRGRVRPRPAPTVRRASAGRRVSPRRALAALSMVLAAFAFYGLTASPAFGVRSIATTGATLSGDAAVLAALALPTAPADQAAPSPADDSAGVDPGTVPGDTGADGFVADPFAPDATDLGASDGTDAFATPADALATPEPTASDAGAAPADTAQVDTAPNVVTLDTSPLAARVATLPAVASVRVSTALPDVVQVIVTEREPILVWAAGAHRFLVDRDGRVLADAGAPDATAGATEAAASLPVVADDRSASTALVPGSVVDPIDLDAATRLASLTVEDIGSKAKEFTVRVTDETGWELAVPDRWTAIFGFYTQSVRKASLIPSQVRLLRSLLGVREDRLRRVILASGEAGTYTLR